MIIKPMKVLNLKGELIDLEIKRTEVDIDDNWKVKYFLRHLEIINKLHNYSDNINNDIQHYVSDLSYHISIVNEDIINNGFKDLNKYFNLEQLKYFKILAIDCISKDYYYGFRARMFKKYYEGIGE